VIIEQAPGRADAQAVFEREMQGFRDEMKRMGDSLNTMIADYNRQEVSLSPSARLNRQAQIREREEQYQVRAQQLEQRAVTREQELMRPLMTWIQQTIDTLRAQEGYHMILDATGAGGLLVSADPSLDITERVLERLRRGTPPAVSAAPAGRQTTPAAQQPPRTGPQPAPAGVARPRTGTP
jgi:outer membrane protein